MQIVDCRYCVNPDLIKGKRYCERGDLLIAGVSENREDVGKAVVYMGEGRPLIGIGVRLVKHRQNPKFLSYMFSTRYVRRQIQSMAQPSTIFNLYATKLKNVKIPLPSLEEQERIVGILDGMSGRLEELNGKVRELIEGRERQYSFHSSKLLANA